MPFPYGSEFSWDSTGHEEINTWLLWHGHHAAANKTVGAILAYSSYVPHWAHCGSARRYWDFTINGKTQWGNEREFHHYGSTLNAIPLFDHFRAYPQRAHLLLLGSCALLGHLTNIDESGAASMAWHGDPGLLRRDEYSGDYGVGFYGYWRSAGAYLACVPPHGWVCTTATRERRRRRRRLRRRRAAARGAARRVRAPRVHRALGVSDRRGGAHRRFRRLTA